MLACVAGVERSRGKGGREKCEARARHSSLPLKAAEHSLLGLESLLFSGVIFKSRFLESPIGCISSRDKDQTVHSPAERLPVQAGSVHMYQGGGRRGS